MEEEIGFFNIIEKAFDAGYWKGVLILLIVMLFFLIYRALKDPEIKQAIKDWFQRKAYSFNEQKLGSHPYFNSQPRLKYKICNLKFPTAPFKTIIFQTMFRVKLLIDMEKVKEFVKQDFKKMDSNELFLKQDELLSNLRNTFNENITFELEKICEIEIMKFSNYEKALENKAKCSKELYQYIMYSPNGYNDARNKRMEVLNENMEMLRDSITFRSNAERNYYFLELLNASINQAILKAEQDFRSFNGEIEKIFSKYI